MSVAESAQLPIVKIAAGAVIVLCALAGGVITGLIPGVSSQNQPAEAIQAPAAQPEPDIAAIPAERSAPVKPVARRNIQSAANAPAKAVAPVCASCGVVESVNTLEVKGDASGAGAVVGGVTGLIIGNQIGHGKGKTLAKVAGAAGGAYAGHQIEKNAKKTVQYEIAVRMNDGTFRTITQPSGDGLTAGARVKVVENTVVRE